MTLNAFSTDWWVKSVSSTADATPVIHAVPFYDGRVTSLDKTMNDLVLAAGALQAAFDAYREAWL